MFNRLILKLQKLDTVICIKISSWNGRRSIDRIMFAISHFGYGYAYPFIGLIVLIFDYANTRLIIKVGFVSFLIEHTTMTLAKKKFKRIRPFQMLPEIKRLMKIPDKFSFPSGHAAGAFLMATLFHHFYPAMAIPFYISASVIGLSRIYNGVHYPSDVMAGSFLGYFSARVGLAIFI